MLDDAMGWTRPPSNLYFPNRGLMENTNPAEISQNKCAIKFEGRMNQTLPNVYANHSFVMDQSLLDESYNQMRQNTENCIHSLYGRQDVEQMDDDEREKVLKAKRKADAYKTAMCDSHRENRPCEYGQNCSFAHSTEELRLPQPKGRLHPKYKTVLCDKFSKTGFCKYGGRCQFVHKIKNPVLQEQRSLLGTKDDENLRPIDSLGLSTRQRLVRAMPEFANVDRPPRRPSRTFMLGSPGSSMTSSSSGENFSLPVENAGANVWALPPTYRSSGGYDLNISLPAVPASSQFPAADAQRALLRGTDADPESEKLFRDLKRKSFFPSMGRQFQSFYQRQDFLGDGF